MKELTNVKYSYREKTVLKKNIRRENMKKLSTKTKILAVATLMLLIVLTVPMINAQTVTITASGPLMPGTSVPVTGTGFAATSAVGIGIGEEVMVTGEVHAVTNVTVGGPTVYGPFTATTLHYPIKPGSFSFHCDVSGVTSDYSDDYANGTLVSTSTYAIAPFVNYVTGEFGRSSSASWETYNVTYTATYIYYHNVTPSAGVTTNPSGGFTASIAVPSDVVNGNYNVTAIDVLGNIATSAQTFQKIPEGLTFGVMMLMSTVAVLVGSHYFWNRSKKQEK